MAMLTLQEIIDSRMLSDTSGEDLNICRVCNRALLPTDFYLIAKAYQSGRCCLEMIQCMACQMNLQDYASEQSIENVMLYGGRKFMQFIEDPIQRKVYHLQDPSCLITGEEIRYRDEFELYCFNLPGAITLDHNFLLVGPTAMEQMSDLISEETRRSWGKYMESLAPDHPEIRISPFFL